jgi:hypothetical protein
MDKNHLPSRMSKHGRPDPIMDSHGIYSNELAVGIWFNWVPGLR